MTHRQTNDYLTVTLAHALRVNNIMKTIIILIEHSMCISELSFLALLKAFTAVPPACRMSNAFLAG